METLAATIVLIFAIHLFLPCIFLAYKVNTNLEGILNQSTAVILLLVGVWIWINKSETAIYKMI